MTLPDIAPVLIVDDDELVRGFLQRQLGRLSIPTVMAASAEEALPLAEAGQFSALVLDVAMEGRSGLDLAEFVRLFGSHLTDIPIFVFTGTMLSNEALALADRVHAEVFLKPEGLDALLNRIADVIDPTHQVATLRRTKSREFPASVDDVTSDYTEPES